LQLLRVLDLSDLKTEDVFKRVHFAVWKLSNGSQVPWEASSLTGDFYFRPTANHPDEAIVAKLDAVTWNEVEDAENPALVERYIRQFPAGAFVQQAKTRVTELKSGAHASKLPKPGRWQAAACNVPNVPEITLYVHGHDLYGWWWSGQYGRGSDGEFLTRFDETGQIAPVGYQLRGSNNLMYVFISGTFPAAVNLRITGASFCRDVDHSFEWVSEN
jgi:hypothetical protein